MFRKAALGFTLSTCLAWPSLADNSLVQKITALTSQCESSELCAGIISVARSDDGITRFSIDPSFCADGGKGLNSPFCSEDGVSSLACLADSTHCGAAREFRFGSNCTLKPNIEDGWCCHDSVQDINVCGAW